jgi:hypothetical protein
MKAVRTFEARSPQTGTGGSVMCCFGMRGSQAKRELIMNKSNIVAVLVASALAIVMTAAVAQNNGENRGTAYGQGGTAGTHPTGANVGPGRAEQNHSTGN